MSADLEFGPYKIKGKLGILLWDAKPVEVGHRAVSLLRLLVERAGEPLAKEDLIAAAWPGLTIEDSNLTVQISALRKVFAANNGVGWIETLHRRGYRWIGPLATTAKSLSAFQHHVLFLPAKPSIVVMPFANLGNDPEQGYLADGMVDDIITALSRIKWLFVIGRGTTFALKSREGTAAEIETELGVRYRLQGSMRRLSDRLRVNCQLFDATIGSQVWAEKYERKLDEIFALQDDIAVAVVGALEPSLKRAEMERVKRKRPDSLDAYDLVLQAQQDVDSGMPEQSLCALELLKRSLALLPTYALAHANAAMCHHSLYLRAGLKEENRRASLTHAKAALIYGQDDALAMTYAAFSLGMDGHDRASATTAFEAALALSVSSALTYILGSVVFAWGGEAKRAIEWSRSGLRLSPCDPWAFAAHDAESTGQFLLGQYAEAAFSAQKSILANPAHSITYVKLAAALAKLGRIEEARAAAAQVLQLQPNFRFARQFAGVGCDTRLATVMGEALKAAGLPE